MGVGVGGGRVRADRLLRRGYPRAGRSAARPGTAERGAGRLSSSRAGYHTGMPSWGACADEEIRVGEAGRPARFLHAGRGRPMAVEHVDGENRRDWGWVLATGLLPHVEQPERFVASVLAFLGAGGRP